MNRIVDSVLLTVLLTPAAFAQFDYEQEPISYSTAQPTDPVARLAERLRQRQVSLVWDPHHGYLTSVLQQLEIPASSQVLEFSKTSLQVSRITPRTPRAVYFHDDVYVGWVQRGDVVEFSAADPLLGGTFYTLEQKPVEQPVIQRETTECLQCHGSAHTHRVPGHIVRSVYPDRRGLPVYRLGTHLTDDTSPFAERFGGWYVTGTHGRLRHMGNVWIEDENESEQLDTEAGANVTDLSDLVSTSPYLTPHSDLVALMVLQHQATMHNLLTAAGHAGRITARDAVIMNRALDRPEGFESESTGRRYASAAEKVVRGLLFCGEPRLTDPIAGTSSFAADFVSRGLSDSQGRSLRQLDLKSRLFRYPCSFLIDSASFRALPDGVRRLVWRRLAEVLNSADNTVHFGHLTWEDRLAIREILLATCPEATLELGSSATPRPSTP